MRELIDRQAAIDALKEHRALYCDNTPDSFSKLSYAEKSRVDELDTAIATLVNLPSAQETYEERTETHVCDLISRQAALEKVRAMQTYKLFMGDDMILVDKAEVQTELMMLPTAQSEPQWISVTERLPDNADHPGAFCPRYQVVTPYGVTEGWYRPHDHEKGGQWFALFWFMSQIYEIWNIDFERGDVPKVIGEAPVMEWRPLPEPYKPNK